MTPVLQADVAAIYALATGPALARRLCDWALGRAEGGAMDANPVPRRAEGGAMDANPVPRRCTCGAPLSPRNRTGTCPRCANKLYGRRYYTRKKDAAQAVPCAAPSTARVTVPVPPPPPDILAECAALPATALLTADQEVRLAACIAMGGSRRAAATAILVERNQGLIHKQIARYTPRGLERDDLVQEGNCGLLEAARRFVAGRGRFSTYAVIWIRQAMGRACEDKARVIRLPNHVQWEQRHVAAAADAFHTAHGRDPSTAELAAILGWTGDRLARQRAYFHTPDSLDRLIGEHADEALGNFIPDPRIPDPSDGAAAAALRTALAALQDTAALNARERAVLHWRFGLADGDGRARTLEEVSVHLGVTRERVRQIEARALFLLRAAAAAHPGTQAALLELAA